MAYYVLQEAPGVSKLRGAKSNIITGRNDLKQILAESQKMTTIQEVEAVFGLPSGSGLTITDWRQELTDAVAALEAAAVVNITTMMG